MIQKYGSDANITAMLDRFNWVFFPVFNPDGYIYTKTKVQSPILSLELL